MNRLEKRAEEIMKRGDLIIAQRKRRAAIIRRTAFTASGLCAVLIAGIGIWNTRDLSGIPDRKGSGDDSLITETSSETTADNSISDTTTSNTETIVTSSHSNTVTRNTTAETSVLTNKTSVIASQKNTSNSAIITNTSLQNTIVTTVATTTCRPSDKEESDMKKSKIKRYSAFLTALAMAPGSNGFISKAESSDVKLDKDIVPILDICRNSETIDLNGDLKVNTDDAYTLNAYLFFNDELPDGVSEIVESKADYNKDGKINEKDLELILKYCYYLYAENTYDSYVEYLPLLETTYIEKEDKNGNILEYPVDHIKGTDDKYEFVFNEWYESSYPFGSKAVRENFLEKLNAVREARSDYEWSKYIDTEYLYLSYEIENGNITFDVNEDGETDTLDLYGIYLYCVGNNMECGSFDADDIQVTGDMIKMPAYLKDVIWKNCDKLLDVYNFLEYKYYNMDEISARYILTHSDLFISNTSLEYFNSSYGSYDINGKDTVTEFVYNLYEWMETYLGLESGLYEDNHVTVDDFIFEVYSNHVVLKECKSNAEKVTIPSEINGIPVTIIDGSAFTPCQNLVEVVIPDSVKEIGTSAFANSNFLKTIVIPDSVVKIGETAFANCSSLESIEIPDSVKEIDNGAFMRCTSLKNVKLPSGIEEIVHSMFMYCESLETFVIPDTVKRIDQSAFIYCTSLKSVTVPSSVKEIGPASFLCTGIDKLYYSGTAEEWKKITIAQDNYNLDNIDIECQMAYPGVRSRSDEGTQYMQGDANCDGKINMADVVLVMQSISNPDRYGVNGSDVSHITSQGIINGDMDNNGITNNDALGIQKELLFGE